MLFLYSFIILAYLVLYAFAFAVPLNHGQVPLKPEGESQASFEQWLKEEEGRALQKLLSNIAPRGSNVQDAAAGSVIASPSKENPNYYYQWVRDAGITMQTLVDLYSNDPLSDLSSYLTPILDAYTSLQWRLQHTDNPSGKFSDLSGIGEPKFMPDGSPFTGSWGRPQRDGPALRALTLMSYLRAYNESHPLLWDSLDTHNWFEPLYQADMPANSVIKIDLEYVSRYWQRDGFDLWEEVEGLHFFTMMVQLRSLQEGADIAAAFGDDGAAHWYRFQASEMKKRLPDFWDAEKNHLIETLGSARSGLDCGLLLGSLHGSSPATGNYTSIFPPYSDEVLLSLLALTNDQRERFPINSALASSSSEVGRPVPFAGTGIGRYPEDKYNGYGIAPDGGNPWFLCTSSAAQILYNTAQHLISSSSLEITPLGLPFWSALLSPTPSYDLLNENKTYNKDESVYMKAIERLMEVADEFLSVVRTHTDAHGSLSEQFDRVTGFERGANDLTWSYGAFLQAVWARQRVTELTSST
jgi:glucoamylase